MLQVNEYFDGQVKSIAFNNSDGKSTAGVMSAGKYEFSTTTIEIMHVVSGKMTVMLPGNNEWQDITQCKSFEVPANSKFSVKITEETAYLCTYK